jgi:hypothetical protein
VKHAANRTPELLARAGSQAMLETALAFVHPGVVGSVVGFAVYDYVIKHLEPARSRTSLSSPPCSPCCWQPIQYP